MTTNNPSNIEDVDFGAEVRQLMTELKTENPSLYAKFSNLEADVANYLEEHLADAHQGSEDAGQHATRAKRARDHAEQVKRLMDSDREQTEEARERAQKALEEAEANGAKLSAYAEANASATVHGHGHGHGHGPMLGDQGGMFPPVRPADPLVATMGQLSTLLIGTSPAFANAMRLQTDAVASGMGNLNAIANQQSHYTLDLAATARAVAETYSAKTKPDMHFHLTVADPTPAPAPTPATKK